ncbi:VOC family protein [Oceanobacillus sp. 143]|uniref:Glyoxalase n=1 Tax=Oceanobacillus zhaokaii TaxID=2052660 RepID=A0A345PCI6_9BACI|nr:VOC family protein [Oceanobacillus zhaokaii]AXI07716.1 glyoxalase [Oceanobacillus zhaokaii]QGS67885.1 VOC family protein [Oceanobacillus sp. 143]
MNSSLCMISIKIQDIETAKHFYCETLNFKVERAYGDDIVELSLEGFPIILEKVSNPNTLVYEDNSQVVIGLKTEDIQSDILYLKEKGAKLLYETPQKCPPGHFTVIEDPFGNKIELLEFAK